MNKRYIRIDLEYDVDIDTFSFVVMDNIKRILTEDMPYVKVIFSRDSPKRDELNREVGK